MKTLKRFFLLLIGIAMMSAFTTTSSPAPERDIVITEANVGGAFLVFAGKNGGNIRKSELRGQTDLQVDGCAKGSKIFAYTLEVKRNGKLSTYSAKSNVLSKEMTTALEVLVPGDTFEFKSMKAQLPDSKDVVDVHCEKFIVV